jgi:dsRNA-specific ribonuclease
MDTKISLSTIGDREQFRSKLRRFDRDITPQEIQNSKTIRGVRGESFKKFIADILTSRCDLSEDAANTFTSPPYIATFENAFTSPSVDSCNNYELLETKGDVTVNKAVVDYLTEAHPEFNCPHAVRIYADIKSKFASKSVLSVYSDRLGFEEYITVKELTKETVFDSVLEDVFEAFVGALDEIIHTHSGINVGYSVCYRFMKSLLINTEMSFKYTDLVDAKTRLKELFQYLDNQTLEYTSPTEPMYTTIITGLNSRGQRYEITRANANNKKKSKDMASNALLNVLLRYRGVIGEIRSETIEPMPDISGKAVSVISASINGGPRTKIGEAESFSKQHAESMAAEKALKNLKDNGIFKPQLWEGDFECKTCKKK